MTNRDFCMKHPRLGFEARSGESKQVKVGIGPIISDIRFDYIKGESQEWCTEASMNFAGCPEFDPYKNIVVPNETDMDEPVILYNIHIYYHIFIYTINIYIYLVSMYVYMYV